MLHRCNGCCLLLFVVGCCYGCYRLIVMVCYVHCNPKAQYRDKDNIVHVSVIIVNVIVSIVIRHYCNYYGYSCLLLVSLLSLLLLLI